MNRSFIFEDPGYDQFKVELQEFLLDESLKGEFVRSVMADEKLTEEEKAAVIRYGLQAIAGEEVAV